VQALVEAGPAGLSAQFVAEHVAGGGVKPGELVVTWYCVESTPGGQECLRGDVAGRLLVRAAGGEAHDRPVVTAIQRLEVLAVDVHLLIVRRHAQ
jgi:hypothetical protein